MVGIVFRPRNVREDGPHSSFMFASEYGACIEVYTNRMTPYTNEKLNRPKFQLGTGTGLLEKKFNVPSGSPIIFRILRPQRVPRHVSNISFPTTATSYTAKCCAMEVV